MASLILAVFFDSDSHGSRESFRAVRTAELQTFFKDPSYHGAITGEEAERKLREHGGNCYLTRYSESREVYVLSVYKDENQLYAQYDIKDDDELFEIVGIY